MSINAYEHVPNSFGLQSGTVTTVAGAGGYGGGSDTVTNWCSTCNTFGCSGCHSGFYVQTYPNYFHTEHATLMKDGIVQIGARKFQWNGKHWVVVL